MNCNLKLFCQKSVYILTFLPSKNYLKTKVHVNVLDQSMEPVTTSEDLEKQSSVMSCVSPNSSEVQQHEETVPDKGKRKYLHEKIYFINLLLIILFLIMWSFLLVLAYTYQLINSSLSPNH